MKEKCLRILFYQVAITGGTRSGRF